MDILGALVERNVIDNKDVDAIKQEAQQSGLTIEEALLKWGISPDLIVVLRCGGKRW